MQERTDGDNINKGLRIILASFFLRDLASLAFQPPPNARGMNSGTASYPVELPSHSFTPTENR